MSLEAMWNVFAAHVSFSPDALVGVGLIGVYFAYILATAIKRIKNADHMDH